MMYREETYKGIHIYEKEFTNSVHPSTIQKYMLPYKSNSLLSQLQGY